MNALFSSALALLCSFVIFSGSTASAGLFDKVPTKSGNYCKDEVTEYMAKNFRGAKVTEVNKSGGGLEWAMWVVTDACPNGNLVFEFRGIEGYNCTMAQYGSRTRFLRYVWSTGECESILKGTDYP